MRKYTMYLIKFNICFNHISSSELESVEEYSCHATFLTDPAEQWFICSDVKEVDLNSGPSGTKKKKRKKKRRKIQNPQIVGKLGHMSKEDIKIEHEQKLQDI